MRRKILSFLCLGMATAITLMAVSSDYRSDATEPPVAATDEYSFQMRLKVPQVKDNAESKGYRKMEWQTIKGKFYIVWREDGSFSLDFSDVKNDNFKVRGVKVSYEGLILDYAVPVNFVYIGDNKKNKFETPCLSFYVELVPSYAMGQFGEDNSFVVLLAGDGRTKKVKSLGCRIASRFSGGVGGTQGCGCMLFKHKSPTRAAGMLGPTDKVVDVVPTYGRWTAHWKKRTAFIEKQ